MEDSLRERLLQAYSATSFVADTPQGRLELRIGNLSPRLDRLLASLGAQSWAYLTAFNPRSEPLSDAENEKRHRRLEERIDALGFFAFAGEGVGDDGTWPAERSLLVIGVSRSEAIDLGREFGQLAVVRGDLGSPPELIET
jgi:hypothetical protein